MSDYKRDINKTHWSQNVQIVKILPDFWLFRLKKSRTNSNIFYTFVYLQFGKKMKKKSFTSTEASVVFDNQNRSV